MGDYNHQVGIQKVLTTVSSCGDVPYLLPCTLVPIHQNNNNAELGGTVPFHVAEQE